MDLAGGGKLPTTLLGTSQDKEEQMNKTKKTLMFRGKTLKEGVLGYYRYEDKDLVITVVVDDYESTPVTAEWDFYPNFPHPNEPHIMLIAGGATIKTALNKLDKLVTRWLNRVNKAV
jgi:hypothetical protein